MVHFSVSVFCQRCKTLWRKVQKLWKRSWNEWLRKTKCEDMMNRKEHWRPQVHQRYIEETNLPRCISPNCKMYFYKLQNVFVKIIKCICPNYKMYLCIEHWRPQVHQRHTEETISLFPSLPNAHPPHVHTHHMHTHILTFHMHNHMLTFHMHTHMLILHMHGHMLTFHTHTHMPILYMHTHQMHVEKHTPLTCILITFLLFTCILIKCIPITYILIPCILGIGPYLY